MSTRSFRHTVGGVDFERLWANPHWPMWYLAAMFFWRLMTPIFKRMPGKVVVAVAISLVAGLYANDILDNARIFGLLPFFVLGLKMHEGHWNLLRTRRARWYGVAVLVVPVRARALLQAAGSRPSGSTTARATTSSIPTTCAPS